MSGLEVSDKGRRGRTVGPCCATSMLEAVTRNSWIGRGHGRGKTLLSSSKLGKDLSHTGGSSGRLLIDEEQEMDLKRA